MKQIIGLGGGGFISEKSPNADLYIIAQSKKEKPVVCFLPTASGDNQQLSQIFEYLFSYYGCKTRVLNLINPTQNIEERLMTSDIIYVGGGNTKSMLAIWREWGVDKILKNAYDKGIILAGNSAGCVCWFKECLSDSVPGKFITLPCLDILPFSNCVHFDETKRQAKYIKRVKEKAIQTGYGIPNQVGAHFVDGELFNVFTTSEEEKYVSFVQPGADETYLKAKQI